MGLIIRSFFNNIFDIRDMIMPTMYYNNGMYMEYSNRKLFLQEISLKNWFTLSLTLNNVIYYLLGLDGLTKSREWATHAITDFEWNSCNMMAAIFVPSCWPTQKRLKSGRAFCVWCVILIRSYANRIHCGSFLFAFRSLYCFALQG